MVTSFIDVHYTTGICGTLQIKEETESRATDHAREGDQNDTRKSEGFILAQVGPHYATRRQTSCYNLTEGSLSAAGNSRSLCILILGITT